MIKKKKSRLTDFTTFDDPKINLEIIVYAKVPFENHTFIVEKINRTEKFVSDLKKNERTKRRN